MYTRCHSFCTTRNVGLVVGKVQSKGCTDTSPESFSVCLYNISMTTLVFWFVVLCLNCYTLIHLSGDIGGAQFCFHARIFNG